MYWTNQEVELLKNHFLKEGEYFLSKLLNKSPNAIKIKAFRCGMGKLKARKDIQLSHKEDQILLGTLLGDTYCRIKKSCKHALIEGAHCKYQEPYLLWKVNCLKNFQFNLRRTKIGNLFFESKQYPCLNDYHILFYKNGKKEVSIDILDKLDALALAVWYMDDGTYRKRDKNSRLCTNGFTHAENKLIQEWFKTKWDITAKIAQSKDPKRHPGKIWYFLQFNATETRKLIAIIQDYIHPLMNYKIGVNETKSESKN